MSSRKKSDPKIGSNVAPSVTESTTPAAIASVNPVPSSVSTPPAHWVEPARLGRKGRRPRDGLNLVAPSLAADLRANASALSQELGSKAVDPQLLAAALDTAHAWTSAESKAAVFHTYTRAQRGTSWDAAMTLMSGMKLGVRYALARDASFADRFPDVAKAFASRPQRRKKTAEGDATPVSEAPLRTSATVSEPVAASATSPQAPPARTATNA